MSSWSALWQEGKPRRHEGRGDQAVRRRVADRCRRLCGSGAHFEPRSGKTAIARGDQPLGTTKSRHHSSSPARGDTVIDHNQQVGRVAPRGARRMNSPFESLGLRPRLFALRRSAASEAKRVTDTDSRPINLRSTSATQTMTPVPLNVPKVSQEIVMPRHDLALCRCGRLSGRKINHNDITTRRTRRPSRQAAKWSGAWHVSTTGDH